MTHIDISNYANGRLRLSRHGANRGGNVFMNLVTGEQCDVDDKTAEIIDNILTRPDSSSGMSDQDATDYYVYVAGAYGLRKKG